MVNEIDDLKYLIKSPMGVFRSIIYSSKLGISKIYKIPIISSNKSILKKSKTSKILITHRLNMGLVSTRVGEIGQIKHDRCILRLGDNSKLHVNGYLSIFTGARIIVGPNATLELGNNSFISSDTKIICRESIRIGDNCAVS